MKKNMLYKFLGYKIGMTQIFDDKKNLIPITLIKIENGTVIGFKIKEIHGYNAVQFGYKNNVKKITKPQLGVFLKKNLPIFKYIKELKINEIENYSIGNNYNIDTFKIDTKINISALSIGKGNVGNIKRHGFNRGPMSHGSKHHRLQGSIGAGTTPGRVIPGKKMPGRLGNTKITIKNLTIIHIDFKNQILGVKGSLPGKYKNLITITYSI
jgi:large subunit ribosomal protein L3